MVGGTYPKNTELDLKVGSINGRGCGSRNYCAYIVSTKSIDEG